MSAAKHRGTKGSSPPAANEKGAQPGGGEEPPAKKPAAAGHGRGGRSGGGGRSGASPRRGWAMLLGAAVVLGAALPAGWYMLQLQEEVGRSAREVEASGRQRQELAATLDTVVQKVVRRRGRAGWEPSGRSVLLGGAGGSSRPCRGADTGVRPLYKELCSCRMAWLAGKRTCPVAFPSSSVLRQRCFHGIRGADGVRAAVFPVPANVAPEQREIPARRRRAGRDGAGRDPAAVAAAPSSLFHGLCLKPFYGMQPARWLRVGSGADLPFRRSLLSIILYFLGPQII